MEPRKKGGGLTWLVIAGVIAYYIFSEEVPQPPPNPPSSGSPALGGDAPRRTAATPERYALQAARNTWPPVKGTANGEGKAAGTTPEGLLAVNYYVVLDGSGSMSETQCTDGRPKQQVATEALDAFARAVPDDANLGLSVFNNDQLVEVIPLGPKRLDALASLRKLAPGGSTPLYNAILHAYEKLTQQGERQQGYGEYHLVVLTDGMASKGQDPTSIVRSIFAESPVVLHTIGFCIGEDHALNQPGQSYYSAANNPAELRQGLEGVLAESPAFDVAQFGRRP